MNGRECGAKSNFLSYCLPRRCQGMVHSKFRQGFHLLLAGQLVYIGCKNFLAPFGIQIEQEMTETLLETLQTGDLAIYKEGRLLLYSRTKVYQLDCTRMQEKDLRIPHFYEYRKKIPHTAIYAYLKEIDFSTCIGVPWEERTIQYVRLIAETDKENFEKNLEIAAFFAGRGKGLTPGGDDFLLGCTLALRIYGVFPLWQRAVSQAVSEQTTTSISAAYRKALDAGYIHEGLWNMVQLLHAEDSEAAKESIRKVQDFGHTSGNDTLFGFFTGLNFLINLEEDE